jgi:PAS domain S-box-containing protein/diguanylate cyclase (GGDEF)-like protein
MKSLDTRKLPRPIAAIRPAASGGGRFLIVDNHPSNVTVLRTQLEAEGCTVFVAANGVEALRVLEREHVDGVVSDILMPRMDGYRLCLEVRKSKNFGALPFVLYTGTYNSPADRELACTAGADAYIEKPAPIKAILAELRAAAGKPRQAAAIGATPELETPILRQYNEALVRKLEEKSADLGRAYEGLAQSEARISGMVEAAMDAIVTVDEQHCIILFNAAAEKMFGYPRADVLGRPLDAFLPPRFREAHGRQIALFGQTEAGTQLMELRTVWGLRRDGTEFPIEASVSKLDTLDGRRYTVFLRDITARYGAEHALAGSEAALRRAQQLAKLAHVVTGPSGEFESYSDTLAALIGTPSHKMPATSRQWFELVHKDDRAALRKSVIHAVRSGARTQMQYRLRRGDDVVYLHHVMDPLREPLDPTARASRWFHTMQDISAAKQAELRILRLNCVLSALGGINALIVRTSNRDELLQESCRIAVEAGQFPKAWIGLIDDDSQELRFAAGFGGSEAFYESVRSMLREHTLQGSRLVATAIRALKPAISNDLLRESRPLKDAVESGSRSLAVLPLIVDGRAVGVLAIHAEIAGFFDLAEVNLLRELAGDISLAVHHLKKAEREDHVANYDKLTGLPNRRLFAERLAQALLAPAVDGAILAVILLDLERFRRINQTHGRAAGDELLQLVGWRLQQVTESPARIGADVFAFKVRGKRTVTEVALVLEDISAACFGAPFTLGGEELRIGSRFGVAVFPGDGADAETLLRNAEAALRRARSAAEHCVFYAPVLNARAAEALRMESKLRRAIERQEFVLYYQPKITLADRRISGVEALMRWRDPTGGLVLPGQFIPVLEESGLIGAVGQWALHQALTDQKRWRTAGYAAPRVAVNVSSLQLRKHDFAEMIAQIVRSNEGAALELEITESMIIEQVDRTIEALKRIRACGVNVAIDDFGTGYCSLSYIAKLPVTSLKIDRAFILGMSEGPEGLAIVSSIIALAHSLKLNVVAEGVETEEQARLLQLLACDEAQGYLFSKPLPSEALEELLRDGCALPLENLQASPPHP